jgi:hypothetical protein
VFCLTYSGHFHEEYVLGLPVSRRRWYVAALQHQLEEEKKALEKK